MKTGSNKSIDKDQFIKFVTFCIGEKGENDYLSKILYNWEKAGFETLEDVKNAEKEKPQVEESTKENEKLFDYDWLNDNE